MTMGSSELACTIESTTGKTKLFPEVNLFFDVCCRHWVTMLFSFEIALKSFVLPRQLWSSLKFMSKNQRNISNFRLFTHVMCWIELCQYHFWDFWKKIITFKKKISLFAIRWHQNFKFPGYKIITKRNHSILYWNKNVLNNFIFVSSKNGTFFKVLLFYAIPQKGTVINTKEQKTV